MKKSVKITLISAGAVMLAGAVVSSAAIALGAGRSIGEMSYRTETITDKITSVNVSVDYDDVEIVTRDTDKISVRCMEGGTKKYSITAQGGMLTIENASVHEKKLKWYEYIHFDFLGDNDEHKLVIEVPRGFEADIVIKNSYGDVDISGVKGSLSAVIDCGDAEIESCTLTSLDCTADYGDIEIKHTLAKDIKADNNCGDIYFEEVTGNITAECDFGDIEFEYVSGDNLAFSCDCGDIEGIIRGKEADYKPEGSKKLHIKRNLGDVKVRFTE